MASLAALANQAPGVFVTEQLPKAGATIATFNRLYIVGTASALATGRSAMEPYQIVSLEDFTNQFGSSSAVILDSIEWLFNYYRNAQVYYIAVEAAPKTELAVSRPVSEGDVFEVTLTIDAVDYLASYTAVLNDQPEEVITALITAINNNTSVNTVVEAEPERDGMGDATYDNALFYLRAKGDATSLPTIALSATITEDNSVADEIWHTDYIKALESSITEDLAQGYLVCPEAYHDLLKQGDRTAVQAAAELEVSRQENNWVHIADFGPPTIITDLAAARAERKNYTSLRGHSWYVGPWPQDKDNDVVSPAIAQAGFALKRTTAEGVGQPPAGTQYPLLGLSKLPYKVSLAERNAANEEGINLIVKIRTRGLCVFGARTLSAKPVYRFANRRVILNTYARSLDESLVQADIVFTLVEGTGVLMNRIREVIDQTAYRFWAGGLFFGGTPELAYLNVCDETNNPNLDIESGAVVASSSVKLSTTGERIYVDITPVSIAGSLI